MRDELMLAHSLLLPGLMLELEKDFERVAADISCALPPAANNCLDQHAITCTVATGDAASPYSIHSEQCNNMYSS